MNRILLTVPKSSLRIHRVTPFFSSQFTTRHFSVSSTPTNKDDGAEIKSGFVKMFLHKQAFGFIVPDGVDKNNHKKSEIAFIHSKDIKRPSVVREDLFLPRLRV